MVSRTSKSKHTCLFLILAVKNSPWKMLVLVDFMQTPFRIRRTSPSCLTSFFITLYKKVRNAYWISVILSYILRWSFFVFFSNWSLAHRFLNDKTNLPSWNGPPWSWYVILFTLFYPTLCLWGIWACSFLFLCSLWFCPTVQLHFSNHIWQYILLSSHVFILHIL